jgi:hypothetical protein
MNKLSGARQKLPTLARVMGLLRIWQRSAYKRWNVLWLPAFTGVIACVLQVCIRQTLRAAPGNMPFTPINHKAQEGAPGLTVDVAGKVVESVSLHGIRGCSVSLQRVGPKKGMRSSDYRFRASTGTSGIFSLRVPPGRYRLEAVHRNYVLPFLWSEVARRSTPVVVDVVGQAVKLPAVQLTRGLHLYIQCRDGAGRPVAGAKLLAEASHPAMRGKVNMDIVLNQDGGYRSPESLIPGTRIRLNGWGNWQVASPAEVFLPTAGGISRPYRITLRRYRS